MEQRFGVAPGQTGIGDGHAVGQGLVRIPALPLQVTFQHEAHDGPPALLKLFEDVAGDFDLPLVILAGVVVRAVNHYGTGQPFARDSGFSAGDVFDAVVVRHPAAQHNVMIGVAGGFNDGGDAVGIHADKWCGLRLVIIALMATCRLPSVPFLKPTGMERPLAISGESGFPWCAHRWRSSSGDRQYIVA